MTSELQEPFINYYELLHIPQDASIETLQSAFDAYVAANQAGLNNPLRKDEALHAHNFIEPRIRQFLLASPEVRAAYDEKLRHLQSGELADNEGLDDALRQPFFFDPIDGYDTELPAYSLRQIADKLDIEWTQAQAWITDNADETHVFVGFLTHVAQRPRLARRIEQIIEGVRRKRIDANEGIEQCILILNPDCERPTVNLHSAAFDGTIFDAGSFVPDLPAHTEITIAHEGMRGCAFGVLESRTDWMHFPNGQRTMPFVLMPEGTDAAIGKAEVSIPLQFQMQGLTHDAEHFAHLLIRLPNHEPTIERPIVVHVHVQPVPPRVVFNPPASVQHPLLLQPVRRGTTVAASLVASNPGGDEHLYPLTARITSRDSRASATPGRFHVGERITLFVDTSTCKPGSNYGVTFSIDYGLSPGATGPDTLYVSGRTLPTPRQSLLLQRSPSNRVIISIVAGILGYAIISGGAWLAISANLWWLLLVILPALFTVSWLLVERTIRTHRQRAEDAQSAIARMKNWTLWVIGVPSILTILFLSIFALTGNFGAFALFSGLAGILIGLVTGFIVDAAEAQANKPQEILVEQHM